jgi:hypothetical protein
MTKLMMVVGMLVMVGCAGSTSSEDSAASLTAAVSKTQSSSSGGGGEENADRPQQGKGHRGPPPEAFTACEGKVAGDACTVTHDEHSITGTCASPPADAPDTRLACRPDHMPEGGPGGPPPGRGQGGERDCDGKGEGKPADSE